MKKVLMAAVFALFCSSALAQPIKCEGVNKTFTFNQPWGDYTQKYTRNLGNFADNDALIIKIDIPQNVPLSKKAYTLSGGEWQDNGVPRYIRLSSKPCDFASETSGTSFSATFFVNSTQVVLKSYGLKLPQPTFKPGDTVYINIKNPPNGCYGACNVFWSFK
jgi:hypothetical protein